MNKLISVSIVCVLFFSLMVAPFQIKAKRSTIDYGCKQAQRLARDGARAVANLAYNLALGGIIEAQNFAISSLWGGCKASGLGFDQACVKAGLPALREVTRLAQKKSKDILLQAKKDAWKSFSDALKVCPKK